MTNGQFDELVNKQFILKDSSQFWVLDEQIDKSYWSNDKFIEKHYYHIITTEDKDYWPMTLKTIEYSSTNRQGMLVFEHFNGVRSRCDTIYPFNTIKLFTKNRFTLLEE